jgi:hypothetical protein
MADDRGGVPIVSLEDRARLEEMGEAYVSQVMQMTGGFPAPFHVAAVSLVSRA